MNPNIFETAYIIIQISLSSTQRASMGFCPHETSEYVHRDHVFLKPFSIQSDLRPRWHESG